MSSRKTDCSFLSVSKYQYIFLANASPPFGIRLVGLNAIDNGTSFDRLVNERAVTKVAQDQSAGSCKLSVTQERESAFNMHCQLFTLSVNRPSFHYVPAQDKYISTADDNARRKDNCPSTMRGINGLHRL